MTRSWVNWKCFSVAPAPSPRASQTPSAQEAVPDHPLLSDRLRLSLGGFSAQSTTQARLGTSNGGVGIDVDFESTLGLDERKLVAEAGAYWRFGERWRVDANYFNLNRGASRTLILTDLAFNISAERFGGARLFYWLVGAGGRFGPHRIIRYGIRDRRAARASLERILEWDFDRVIVSHGDVLESGGRASLAAGFSFL